MKINLQITYVGGDSREVTANAADMVAFEDKFDKSIAILTDSPKMSHLLFLAYAAEKRTGATKDSWEKWLETVESVGAKDSPK